jgi:succinate-semialdehyde dehydrogenase / glutarate-semialdehyde dehydrogenase
MRDYRLYLQGQWRSGSAGETKSVINPATEHAVARVACATERDLDEALDAAAASASSWGGTPAKKRGRILVRAADILRTKIDAASVAYSEEQGKPITEARTEFLRAIDTLMWNGQQAETLCAPVPLSEGRFALPEPAGVVAAFIPWNYPAVIAARKLGPALAAGCPVILKAAEEAPAAALAILTSLEEAGVPPGVLSLVFGDPPTISKRLLASRQVRVVSFTGSTRVGRELARLAVDQLQRCILELGGHAPVIVLKDADLDTAVRAIADYKFAGAGQSCNAPSRVFVQAPVYESFVDKLTSAAKSIRVGAGNDPDTQMGPIANSRGLVMMERLTADAVARGATATTGGTRLDRPGYFWPPTILRDVPPAAAILQEEPFGPLLPVLPFAAIDEAVAMANANRYGLAAYVLTHERETAAHIAGALTVGSVGINHLAGVAPHVPVGGVNDSGYGYEGGLEGFRSFQSLKAISEKR